MNSRQPGPAGRVVHQPALEMGVARLGVRQRHALVAARGPAAHHGVGDVHVELQRIGGAAVAERLHRKRIALRQHHAPCPAGRSPRGAIDRRGRASPCRPRGPRRSGGSGNSRPRHGRRVLVDPGAELLAPASARRGRCRETASSPSAATPIQSISRLTNSSSSLALCGPPKITAPLCASSVLGSRRRTADGARRAGCRGCEAGSRPGRAWKARRAGRSGPEGASERSRLIGAEGFMPQTRQSACQSTPIRLMRDCKTVGARADMPPRQGWVASAALELPRCRAAPAGRRAARSAAPARRAACWRSPAPPAACPRISPR